MTQGSPSNGFPPAVYTPQTIRMYVGNKFIEALPPLTTANALVKEIWRSINVTDSERRAPSFERQHMTYTIPNSFMQPLTAHAILATEVSSMIRAGYLGRNPSSPRFLRRVGLAVEAMRSRDEQPAVAGHGMAVIGMSGVGKSTAIDAVLRTYPQVIHHPELSGPLRATFQVTWIKLTCPLDGSIISVCRQFFLQLDMELGTDYHRLFTRNATLESMRDQMAILCFVHGIGLLVIDEVQNLSRAKSGGATRLLNFFLTLRDILQVPVIAIGTEEALPILGESLKIARRHAGVPLFDRMQFDAEFHRFCGALFAAYYLREPFRPAVTFMSRLYHLSQGITDIAIKLFALAQSRALIDGIESIDETVLQLVYDQNLYLLHEHLDRIRCGQPVHGPAYEENLRAVREKFAAGPTAEMLAANALRRDRTSATVAKIKVQSGGLELSHTETGPFTDLTRQITPGATETPRLLEVLRARGPGVSAHEALKAAGFVRDLGAEVIGAS